MDVLFVQNPNTQNTPVISDIQTLDAVLTPKTAGDVLLHHFKGDDYTKESFQPFETSLAAGIDRRFAPAGGRSSNGEWPYYNLQWQGGGMMLAIGWPGQWACRFTREKARRRVRAGQELTHFTLHPGEEIRTPLIAMDVLPGRLACRPRTSGGDGSGRKLTKDHGQPLSPKVAGSALRLLPRLGTPTTKARWGPI